MGKRLIAGIVLLGFFVAGCYNTYYISREQLASLQSAEGGDSGQKKTVKTVDGKAVVVDRSTGLFVRSTGGRKYPISPYNFTLTSSQLVASDRDTLLALDGIKEQAEVEHLSTWKTVLVISAGVAAVGGLITALVVTGGSKQF